VILAAFTWLNSAGVQAESRGARVALSWQAPPASGCASPAEIEREVARLAEHELVTRKQSYRIQALAFLHEGSWVASVTLLDEQGRFLGGRDVSGWYSSCRQLDVPVALVIATLLDGLRAPPPPPSKRAPSVRAPGAREDRLGVGAFVAGALGLVPDPAFGFGAGVDLALGWPVALEGSVYLPRAEVDAAGRGARASAFHAGASACPRLVGQRHELRLCGGVQAGAVVARGEGLSESLHAAEPLLLVGLEPKLLIGLTERWALQLSIAAHWVAVHPRFTWEIEGGEQRSVSAQPIAATARIGLINFLR
jgi:hypothetical protein